MIEIKPLQVLTHAPVTRNLDDDSIKNEQASMEKSLSHYKSIRYFRHSRAANSVVDGRNVQKIQLLQDFMHVLVTCKSKKA